MKKHSGGHIAGYDLEKGNAGDDVGDPLAVS